MNNLMTKSFLSYQELKKEALKDDLEAAAAIDPEISVSASIELTEKNLLPFLEEANLIKAEISSIQDLLTNLHTANDSSKSTHRPDSLKSLRHQINSQILQILKKAKSIRENLESLDRANAANRRLSGFKEGTSIDRTRTAITNGLRKKLKDLMMEFQDLRQKTMAEYKETVERRYFTITGKIPDDHVIEKIIQDGESEDLLKKAILEHGKGKIVETVTEIQDRYGAAKEIEKSLLELHQVFLDMAVMVEAQGEKMDDIEHHVSSASHYVRSGTKELKTAKDYQRSNRKWLWIGIILLMILVLVIVIPIVASLSSKS